MWPVILDTAVRLRRTGLYAALMVGAATLPLFFLRGDGGAFLPPIALAYLLAVAVSMIVTFTVTPALAMLLLDRDGSPGAAPRSGWLQRRSEALAAGTAARSGVALAAFARGALLGAGKGSPGL